MSWVLIDPKKCNQCGLCARICERRCFGLNRDAVVSRADASNCSLCGHCAAICPNNAVRHLKLEDTGTVAVEGGDVPDSAAFKQFIRSRRSHRHFKKRPVTREILKQLADVCRYCPTGSNDQTVQVLYLTRPEEINELSGLCVDYFRGWVETNQSELDRAGDARTPELDMLRRRMPMIKRHIAAWESGEDPILRKAPVVMIFHSTPFTSTPKDNCVIAAHTVTLYARTLGLESCYIGLLEKASLGYEPVRTWLNLPEGHRVCSVLILGYPRFAFARTVDRKPIPIQYR